MAVVWLLGDCIAALSVLSMPTDDAEAVVDPNVSTMELLLNHCTYSTTCCQRVLVNYKVAKVGVTLTPWPYLAQKDIVIACGVCLSVCLSMFVQTIA